MVIRKRRKTSFFSIHLSSSTIATRLIDVSVGNTPTRVCALCVVVGYDDTCGITTLRVRSFLLLLLLLRRKITPPPLFERRRTAARRRACPDPVCTRRAIDQKKKKRRAVSSVRFVCRSKEDEKKSADEDEDQQKTHVDDLALFLGHDDFYRGLSSFGRRRFR